MSRLLVKRIQNANKVHWKDVKIYRSKNCAVEGEV